MKWFIKVYISSSYLFFDGGHPGTRNEVTTFGFNFLSDLERIEMLEESINLIKSLSREYQNLRFINLIIPNVGNRTKKNQIDYNRYVDSLSKIIKVKYKFYRSKNQKIDYII